jgi:hypothetical protein
MQELNPKGSVPVSELCARPTSTVEIKKLIPTCGWNAAADAKLQNKGNPVSEVKEVDALR